MYAFAWVVCYCSLLPTICNLQIITIILLRILTRAKSQSSITGNSFHTQDFSTTSSFSSLTYSPDRAPQNGYTLNGEIILPLITATSSLINPLPMSNLLTSNGKDVAIPVIINQKSCLYPFNPDPATCLLDGPELIVPVTQNYYAINPITKENLTNEIILPEIVKSKANFFQVTSSIYILNGEVITSKFIPSSHLVNYPVNPFLFSTTDAWLTPVLVSSSASFNTSGPFQLWNNTIFYRNGGLTQDLSNGYNFNGESIIPLVISADSILNPYPSSNDLLTEAYGQDVSIPMIIKRDSCLNSFLNSSLSPECKLKAPEMILPTLGSFNNIEDNIDHTNLILVTRILSSQINLTKQSSYELHGESINSLVVPWPSSKNLNAFVEYTNASAQSSTLLLVGFSAAALPKATNKMFFMKEKVQRRQRTESDLRDSDSADEAENSANSTSLSISSLWDNWGVKIGAFGFIIMIVWLCLLSLYCSCLRDKREKRRVLPATLTSLYSRNENHGPPPPIIYY